MDLSVSPDAGWRYFSDQVMGGVSEGQASFETVGSQTVLRLTGDVSTENRGGFVQVRLDLPTALSDDTKGVILTVRGNNQPYFIHLRTRGTALPWQYYQAEFEGGASWQEIRLPLLAFKPSGGLLRKTPAPDTIESIGIVAYGRDHQADVSVRAVGFY